MNTRRSIARWWAVGCIATMGLLTTACGADDTRDVGSSSTSPAATATGAAPASTGAPEQPVDWQDDVAKAKEARRVGPNDGCEIPGSFGVAAKWTVQDVSSLGVVDEGLAMRCEIDANPAGITGVMRVWVATDGSTPRAALEKFVRKSALQVTNVSYREVKAGPVDAVEVTYQFEHHLTRAFAVPSGDQVLLVIWGAEEDFYQQGLPAYQLARSSYTPKR